MNATSKVNGAAIRAAAVRAVELHPSTTFMAPCESLADAVLDAALPALLARIAELETERHSTNEALDDAVNAIREKDQRIAELEKALVAATGKTYREAARLLEDTGRDDDSVSLMDNMADAFEPGGTAAVSP